MKGEKKKEQVKEPKEQMKDPSSIRKDLEAARRQVDEQRVRVLHRELAMGLESLSASLDQAIRWAKNVEDVIADIEKKAQK